MSVHKPAYSADSITVDLSSPGIMKLLVFLSTFLIVSLVFVRTDENVGSNNGDGQTDGDEAPAGPEPGNGDSEQPPPPPPVVPSEDAEGNDK